ncbi:MAG: aconitate hydratase, partial [Candidatus Dormibacteraceae bacterium]
LAGTVNIDLSRDPLGYDQSNRPVRLNDLWPTPQEISKVIESSLQQEMFTREYSSIYAGDHHWQEMGADSGNIYAFSDKSTYIQEPPYFEHLEMQDVPPPPLLPSPTRGEESMVGARCLVWVGDSVTTDHISPAGSIPASSPAGEWLLENQVPRADFNSYGSRRGNHQVMMRGTFANLRLRNQLAGGKEGWWTRHQPSGEEMTIFAAAERYRDEGTPLIVIAGKDYGSGSSRDWAAKGPQLLGVRAVIAESFERIHRSNLIGMGIIPLLFSPGESALSLGLSGAEKFFIRGIEQLTPNQKVEIEAHLEGSQPKHFNTTAAVINSTEISYLRHGGVLNTVLQQLNSTPT